MKHTISSKVHPHGIRHILYGKTTITWIPIGEPPTWEKDHPVSDERIVEVALRNTRVSKSWNPFLEDPKVSKDIRLAAVYVKRLSFFKKTIELSFVKHDRF